MGSGVYFHRLKIIVHNGDGDNRLQFLPRYHNYYEALKVLVEGQRFLLINNLLP